MQQTTYGLRVTTSLPFDTAIEQTTAALKAQGFGVITTIDMTATLKAKLGKDIRRYTILGACNPVLSDRALEAELEVGLLLPCNVVVYEGDDRRAVVMAIDPMRTMAAGDAALAEVARDVQQRLTRVLERME